MQHLTVRGSVGLEQAKAVMGALRPVGQALQHAQVGDVERGWEQITHLPHKLGQHHLQDGNRNAGRETSDQEIVLRVSAGKS